MKIISQAAFIIKQEKGVFLSSFLLISLSIALLSYSSTSAPTETVSAPAKSVIVKGEVVDITEVTESTDSVISVPKDSLIKGELDIIYYYAADGKRYVFPNSKTFGSWFSDFSSIHTVSNEELAQMPLGGNITYRPGVRLIKIQTSPKVYVVEQGGILRWVQTERLAEEIYGNDWNKKIDDILDVSFANYEEGDPILSSTEYNATTTLKLVETININRGIPFTASTPRSTTFVGGNTIPAIPAIPAIPYPGEGVPATPAIPAIPAQPSTSTTTPSIPSASSTPAIPATPATPENTTSTPDTTPPIISNVEAIDITEVGATIFWTTDEVSTSKVVYNTNTSTTSLTVSENNFVVNHQIELSNLYSSSTYLFVVESGDENNNVATSAEYNFQTLAPEPVDLCPNLDGIQETIPQGYELVNGECSLIPPLSSPDLGIAGVSGLPVTVTQESFGVTINPKNYTCRFCEHTTPTSTLIAYYTPWYPNDPGYSESDIRYEEQTLVVPPISQWSSADIPWTGTATTTYNRYYFVVKIDPDNLIDETIENNNSYRSEFFISY